MLTLGLSDTILTMSLLMEDSGLAEGMVLQEEHVRRITSLEAVVRELVYNSLDADATNIVIGLDSSKLAVNVMDDGKGIEQSRLLNLGEWQPAEGDSL